MPSFFKFFSSTLDYSKYYFNSFSLSFFILFISYFPLSPIEKIQGRRVFGLIIYSYILFRLRLFSNFFINIYKRTLLFILLQVRLLLYFLYTPIIILYKFRYTAFWTFRQDFNYHFYIQLSQFRSYSLQLLYSLGISFGSGYI